MTFLLFRWGFLYKIHTTRKVNINKNMDVDYFGLQNNEELDYLAGGADDI